MNDHKCPVCKNKSSKFTLSIGSGKLVQCQNCQLFYYLPRPTPLELEQFYNSESYRNQFQDSSMTGLTFASARYKQFQNVLTRFISFDLTKTSRSILDVGCGTGDFLKIAMDHYWQVSGVEISPKAAQDASDKLETTIFAGDIFSLDLPPHSYDVITLYHVIEHLIDPVIFLERIRELLKPNGIFFIETPNIGGIGFKISRQKWSHLIPPEHITYFSPYSLKYTLKKAGFTPLKVFTITPQKIESLKKFPPIFQSLGSSIYRLACVFNLGATLQAIATPNQD